MTKPIEDANAKAAEITPVQAPYLVSWNLTRRCNLKCAHCYLDSDELTGRGDSSTAEALVVLGEIAELCPGAMLIITGGEPLLRADIFEIASAAIAKGLAVVIGTNGTYLSPDACRKLKDAGVLGVGISVDSLKEEVHDSFRGVPGSLKEALLGMRNAREAALDFQLHVSVSRSNLSELTRLMDFAEVEGARVINFFFLVCTGRGEGLTDVTAAEYEEALRLIASEGEKRAARLLVRARCAPHIVRFESAATSSSGCIAARGYLRVSPSGVVTPCPYIPEDRGISLKESSLRSIWEDSEIFKELRSPKLKGRCSGCDYEVECGGCRARALASPAASTGGGDLLGEDPWCEYESIGKESVAATSAWKPLWREDAKERLGNIPIFLRPMIKKGIEKYAEKSGAREITPELMALLKKRFKGDD